MTALLLATTLAAYGVWAAIGGRKGAGPSPPQAASAVTAPGG